MDNRPIGVFDSGLGGLTVLSEVMKLLPGESVVYFGDNGRAPYGTKSEETIIKYTLQDIRFLLNQDIKMIVIACNTASAYGFIAANRGFDIPIVEVITPGSLAAIAATKNQKIGVIGTAMTVKSGIYEKTITKLKESIDIYSKACPLFVSLAEEGWWDNEISEMIAKEYLKDLKEESVDTLVMGCTHYPLLQNTIRKVMGENVNLVNSALEVAKVVKGILDEKNIHRDPEIKPVYRYYTSDSVEKFETLGSAFLKNTICSAEKVDIEKY